jgi:hypothetical protein
MSSELTGSNGTWEHRKERKEPQVYQRGLVLQVYPNPCKIWIPTYSVGLHCSASGRSPQKLSSVSETFTMMGRIDLKFS